MHLVLFFFFNDTATTEIYTLSLHDALPIYEPFVCDAVKMMLNFDGHEGDIASASLPLAARSEEHTSELQSRLHLACRLLLEKKKTLRRPTIICRRSRARTPSAVPWVSWTRG